MSLKLIIGLGNPGAKYETTRHNAGFLVLDEIADDLAASWSESQFKALSARATIFGESCLFLKPQTFMNLSGQSVASAQRFYKVATKDCIVIYDDIDMEPSKVKARVGGGHGGHNGVRSMIAEMGSADFHRLKIGVGRPKHRQDGTVSNWVLNSFSEDELIAIQTSVKQDVLDRLESIFKQSR